MARKISDSLHTMREGRRTQYAYKGYLITYSSGSWYVSKDGYHITSAPTAQAAEREIDGLV